MELDNLEKPVYMVTQEIVAPHEDPVGSIEAFLLIYGFD